MQIIQARNVQGVSRRRPQNARKCPQLKCETIYSHLTCAEPPLGGLRELADLNVVDQV